MPRTTVTKDYVAVLDVGSNAVRLVVYDGLNRAPVKIHNERNVCSLGADLATTGKLSPEGMEKALDSIRRFSGLLTAMKIRHVEAVATAALRDAADGPAFIVRVEKECGLRLRVVDGEEEARLSALGVLMNGLGQNGVIGDYGGGSLELILVEKGRVRRKTSLPLGSHRLQALKTETARRNAVREHLAGVGFLKDCKGLDFYALGGAWRSMARAHIRMTGHPLRVLDHYTVAGTAARDYAALLSRQSLASLEKTEGLSKKRVRDMGAAALAMEELFAEITPARLVFSGTGLREGLLYDRLPPAVQRQDALLASCRKVAHRISRFDDLSGFQALVRWMVPLFPGADAALARLLEAACLLSDTGWFEHEDYQAKHAFERMLVLPLYGIDHAGRAFLALTQYVRYGGSGGDETVHVARRVLPDEVFHAAVVAGHAQRLAYLLTGGALTLLSGSAFDVSPGEISLAFTRGGSDALNAEIIGEELQSLAAVMGKKPRKG